MSKLMTDDPLKETDRILTETFYGGGVPARRATHVARQTEAKAKPTHYKIVCISLYNDDIQRLEELVAELKRRGNTKANKSAVIRFALDQVDISKMPKGY